MTMLGEGKPGWRILNSKALLSIAICLLVASTGVYYAFFACFFLAMVALSHLSNRKPVHATLTVAILIALISGGLLINLLPSLWYRFDKGPNIQASRPISSRSRKIWTENHPARIAIGLPQGICSEEFKNWYSANVPLGTESQQHPWGL